MYSRSQTPRGNVTDTIGYNSHHLFRGNALIGDSFDSTGLNKTTDPANYFHGRLYDQDYLSPVGSTSKGAIHSCQNRTCVDLFYQTVSQNATIRDLVAQVSVLKDIISLRRTHSPSSHSSAVKVEPYTSSQLRQQSAVNLTLPPSPPWYSADTYASERLFDQNPANSPYQQPPTSFIMPPPTPLYSVDDCDHEPFFERSQWKKYVESERSKGRRPMRLGFLTDRNGVVVSKDRRSIIYEEACMVWNSLHSNHEDPSCWKTKTRFAREFFSNSMRGKFEEFRLCKDDWKVEAYATVKYSDWTKRIHKHDKLKRKFENVEAEAVHPSKRRRTTVDQTPPKSFINLADHQPKTSPTSSEEQIDVSRPFRPISSSPVQCLTRAVKVPWRVIGFASEADAELPPLSPALTVSNIPLLCSPTSTTSNKAVTTGEDSHQRTVPDRCRNDRETVQMLSSAALEVPADNLNALTLPPRSNRSRDHTLSSQSTIRYMPTQSEVVHSLQNAGLKGSGPE